MKNLREVLSTKKFVNATKEDSLITKLRLQRISIFKDFIDGLKYPIHILDIGGTIEFWKMMGFANDKNYIITVLNLSSVVSKYQNIQSISGDARNLSEFSDNSFDIVFSNSVIEHVGDYSDQIDMSQEIKRVGKKYFIQTPNYYFPFEPHFLFPFFQYLPLEVKTLLIRNFDLGNRKKTPDKQKAIEIAKSVRLLNKKELKSLFPEGTFYKEKILGLTYSYIIYADC